MHRYIDIPVVLPSMAQDYDRGLTTRALSEKYGLAEETIRRNLKSYGVTMRPRGYPQGKYLPNGGRTIDKSGYVLLLSPHHPNANGCGYVREHRLMAEQMLGRYLSSDEVVHHRDGNKANNHPDNLQVYANQEQHKREDMQGNSYSLGKRYLGKGVLRTKEEMLSSIRQLAGDLDVPIIRKHLRPPYVSYRSLNVAFGHWEKAVEIALSNPPTTG